MIRSGTKEVRLLAFPGLEAFPRSATKNLSLDRARSYIGVTTFEKQSLISGIGDINKLLNDRSGSIRTDWRMTSHDDLENSFMREQILPVGAKACVIGRYSDKKTGIVPKANSGGVRVIRGSREQALSFLRDKFTGAWIAAVFFLLVPGPALWGILTYREHYLDANHKDSVASSLKDLAYERRTQSRFAESEALYKRSLAIKEKALGPDHPDLEKRLKFLAELYDSQGQYAQAEPLYKRALATWEKVLGPNGDRVAMTLEAMAVLYRKTGRAPAAAELEKRAKAIWAARN